MAGESGFETDWRRSRLFRKTRRAGDGWNDQGAKDPRRPDRGDLPPSPGEETVVHRSRFLVVSGPGLCKPADLATGSGSLAKRIDRPHAAVVLPVAEVLSDQFPRAARLRCGQDHGVPERKLPSR